MSNMLFDRQAAFKSYLDFAKDLVKAHEDALVRFDQQDPSGFRTDSWLADIIKESERHLRDFSATGFEAQARMDWALPVLCDRLRRRSWNNGSLVK